MRAGLKFQFMLVSILLVAATVSISTYFFSMQQREVLRREITRRGVTIARSLTTSSVDPLVANDHLLLATLVNSTMRNEGLSYAMVLDEKGAVLAHNRIENVGRAYVEPAGVRPLSNEEILIQPFTNEAGERIQDVALPITLRNGVKVGSAHVGMTQQAIDQLMAQTLQETLWIAAGLLLIGSVVSFVAFTLALRPLQELLRGAHALGEGDLNHHLRIRGRNELAALAEAFNDMATHLKDLYIGMLRAMAKALEARDKFAGGHDQRTSEYAVRCAEHLGLPAEEIENLRLAGQVQNLGHIAVPDSILAKTGKLTADEYTRLKEHTAVGAEILNQVKALRGAVPLVRHHHERFDGHGYPQGLAGTDIPLGARILAVADAYDAMTVTQKHRAALTSAQALEELRRGAGTQFDPQVVAAFIEMLSAQETKA